MAKPLFIYINAPYNEFEQVYGYGIDPVLPKTYHHELMLKTQSLGVVRAATSGLLYTSPRRPDNNADLPAPHSSPLPQTVNLYLDPSPFLQRRPDWTVRLRDSGLRTVSRIIYYNIESATLGNYLRANINTSMAHLTDLTDEQKLRLFIDGEVGIWVRGGSAMGEASSKDAPSSFRQVGFAVLTDIGLVDPAYFYDLMRGFVDEGDGAVNVFNVVAPKAWPVIDPHISKSDAIGQTEKWIYPYSVLSALRFGRNLDDADWRTIGNNQKHLYIERLCTLHGLTFLPGSTEPPFRFNNNDWYNPFQLEAIVEFYWSFPRPFNEGEVFTRKEVNFLDKSQPDRRINLVLIDHAGPRPIQTKNQYLAGDDATVGGSVITLPGMTQGDFDRINSNFDTIYLEEDESPASITQPVHPAKVYRILDYNSAARTVTVDGLPQLPQGITTTHWEIPAGLGIEVPWVAYDLQSVIVSGGGSLGTDHYDGVLFILCDGEVWNRFCWTSYTSRHWRWPGHTPTPDEHQGQSSILGNDVYEFSSLRAGTHNNINYAFLVRSLPISRVQPPTVPSPAMPAEAPGRFYFDFPASEDTNGKREIFLHHGHTNLETQQSDRLRWSGSSGCLVSSEFSKMRNNMIEIYNHLIRERTRDPNFVDMDLQRIYLEDFHRSREIYCATAGLPGQSGQQRCNQEGIAPPASTPTLTANDWEQQPGVTVRKIRGRLWLIHPDEIPLA